MTARLCLSLVALCLSTALTPAQEHLPPTASSSSSARPCSANPVLAYAPSKKSAKHLKHPPAPEPLPTCIEVKGEPLSIQEFLQNLAREQAWRISDNRASEDMWSFVRYFNPDELDTYADTKVAIESVKFSGGKAATTIRATDIGGEYVRVQISAHFEGEGKSIDPTWKQPATVWPLTSKGVFEKQLVEALQTRYKPLD